MPRGGGGRGRCDVDHNEHTHGQIGAPSRPRGAAVPGPAALRAISQHPVGDRNDPPGRLYGTRLSIYLTWALLRAGCSPSVASVGMIVCGVGGSLVMTLGGAWVPIGLFVLVLAFLLDCTDGEMARYLGIDSLLWSAVDTVHHVLLKGLAFLCLGVGLSRGADLPGLTVVGGVGSVCWLTLLLLRDVPRLVFVKKLLEEPRRDANPAMARLKARRAPDAPVDPATTPAPGTTSGPGSRPPPGLWILRASLFSFDVIVPLLALVALADLVLDPLFLLGWTAPWAAWLLWAYTAALLLHVIDCAWAALSRDRLRAALDRLDRRAREYD